MRPLNDVKADSGSFILAACAHEQLLAVRHIAHDSALEGCDLLHDERFALKTARIIRFTTHDAMVAQPLKVA